MEQKDFDIYEILKGKTEGTALYTPMCGKVEFRYLQGNKEAAEAIITSTNNDAEYTFDKNGKYVEEGEVLLFPSDKMRDWSKFAWKKGDVLVNKDRDVYVIFERFVDDAYCSFVGKYYLWKENNDTDQFCKNERLLTSDFQKAGKDSAQTYISTIEERLGGKLNRETLEVEEPKKKPAFEIGKLYVFKEEDEDGELTIIGSLIGKNESEDTLSFGNQYEIENEKFVTDQAFDLRISVHEELREATEGEAVTFKEAYTLWEKQPCFKTFDKVLVSIGSGFKWRPALFIRDHGENCTNRYNVLPLYSGKPADFEHCIPYEGNENIAFADYNSEDLPLPF